ncbi:MAG: divalent-cation tolerance protein CutA, partial [Methanomassiliicoccales archaeon]|nr:divalent-cation tolerance protein CutA [Methanomassiliicoccales archaeon]
PDRDTSEEISRQVLNRRLAACANMFQIQSIYRWEGQVQEENEFAILFKIRDEDFEEMKREVLRLHPYEVPCIVRYQIAEGHAPYLEWISESTTR